MGDSGTIFPYFPGFDGSGGYGIAEGHRGWTGDGFHLWGVPGGTGYGGPGISGDYAGGRCQRTRFSVSDPVLWTDSGLRLV